MIILKRMDLKKLKEGVNCREAPKYSKLSNINEHVSISYRCSEKE